MANKIKFATNVPVELALKFPEGKLVESNFGSPQVMFSTVSDEVLFVSEPVARKIQGIHAKVGEPLSICKKEVDFGNGRKGIEWIVERVGAASGEQPDGTFAVPVSGASVPAPAPAKGSTPFEANLQRALAPNQRTAAEEPSYIHLGWAQFLLSQTNALIDVYAAASAYASTSHGNAVKNEDVRALMTTAFVNISKQGGANVA
jgi:hypothetical protein